MARRCRGPCAITSWCPSVPTVRRRSPTTARTLRETRPLPWAIHVLDGVDGQISAFHAFIDATLLAVFGLPLEPVS